MYNEFRQYRWYEIINYKSKQLQIFSRILEIGVQRSLVLQATLTLTMSILHLSP